MPSDDADRDEDEHRVPTGTWASTPGILAPRDLDEEPGDGVADAEAPPREASGPAPRDSPASPAAPPRDAADSHVRPRFLASELMRQRSESHEPIWPGSSRFVGIVGGGLAAALAVAVAGGRELGVAAAALAILVVLAALLPMAPRTRAAVLALFGGLALLAGASLSRHAPDALLGGAALAATSGAFLRARRFRSLGARGLFVLAAGLGVAGLVLDGGVRGLTIESFSLVDLAPALRQLALGAALLLPLVTLLDASGPSGALAVAMAWILERLVDGALHVALEGLVPAAIGPLVGALVLPAAALGLAQAMPSAASPARRPRRAQAA